MKVLVTGAGGQLGCELAAEVPEGFAVAAFGRAELDITDPASVRETVDRERPDLVINAAAYTAVDRAEAEPDRAFAVNSAGAEHVARETVRVGARLIHLSTDYVFDGTRPTPYAAADTPAPLSVYGASKLEGERRALAAAPGQTLVLRSAWLYSRFGRNFVKTMLGRMRAGEALAVVCDQVGSPTWAGHLADAVWRVAARSDLSGVLHFADAGVASWYDLAVAIQDEALAIGLLGKPVPIEPIRTTDYPTAARRPAYSVLDSRSAIADLGLSALPWRWALGVMLDELAAAEAP